MYSPVKTIQVIAFLDLLAAGLIVPQLPAQVRSLGGGHLLVGFMVSLYSGLQLVSNPMTESLIGLKGSLNVLLVSLSLSGLAYTALGVTNSVLLFLFLRAVLGTTKHTQLLIKAVTPEYVKDKEELSQVFGKLSTLRQAGMIIGPIIGGHIVETFPDKGFTIIAFLVGAIFAFNSGLIRRLPQEEKEQKKEEKVQKKEEKVQKNEEKEQKKKEKDELALAPTLKNAVTTSFNENLELFYKIDWNKYWEIFSFKLILSLCMGVYVNNYVLFLIVKHGASSATNGYIIALFSTICFVTTYFIDYFDNYYKKDKDFTERNLHVFALLTFSFIGVSLAPNVSMYVAFIIPLGVAVTIGGFITQQVILCQTDNDQSGSVLNVASNVSSFTGVVAPLMTGIIAHFAGVLQVVYVAIILAAVGTYKSYLIRLKSEKENEKTKKK